MTKCGTHGIRRAPSCLHLSKHSSVILTSKGRAAGEVLITLKGCVVLVLLGKVFSRCLEGLFMIIDIREFCGFGSISAQFNLTVHMAWPWSPFKWFYRLHF